MERLKNRSIKALRSLEKYTKTDMVYLIKNSFWVNANIVIVNIFSFLLSILFARHLTKETYGTYQFIISISSILGALTFTGMNNAVTQATARGFEGVFQKSVKLQIKYAFIPIVSGLVASIYYLYRGNTTLSISLILVAILLPLGNAFNTWGAFLAGKKEFEGIFKFTQIINVTYYLFMMAAILLLPHTIVLVTLNFFINTITNYFVYKLIVKRYKPNINSEKEALDYGTKLSIFSVLPMLALNIDNIAIFHFYGAQELAIYAFASNIPERMGSLLRPIITIAFPKFSEKTKEDLNKSINIKTIQLFALAVLGSIIYFLISPWIYKIFFPQYIDSIVYSQIYTLVVIMGITGNFVLAALSSTRSSNIFKFNVINPIFNIIIIYIMIYTFGIWGAILGKIAGNTFHLLISRYYLSKND